MPERAMQLVADSVGWQPLESRIKHGVWNMKPLPWFYDGKSSIARKGKRVARSYIEFILGFAYIYCIQSVERGCEG